MKHISGSPLLPISLVERCSYPHLLHERSRLEEVELIAQDHIVHGTQVQVYFYFILFLAWATFRGGTVYANSQRGQKELGYNWETRKGRGGEGEWAGKQGHPSRPKAKGNLYRVLRWRLMQPCLYFKAPCGGEWLWGASEVAAAGAQGGAKAWRDWADLKGLQDKPVWRPKRKGICVRCKGRKGGRGRRPRKAPSCGPIN